MHAKIQVLEAMQRGGIPLYAGIIAEFKSPSRRAVDKSITELKAEELITSTKRCYWQAK